jgi:hypothetical protein
MEKNAKMKWVITTTIVAVLIICIFVMTGMRKMKSLHESVPPIIEIWYGYEQHFGHLGNPQKWINILGRVHYHNELVSVKYSLNGGDQLSLSIGPDHRRLARLGDFNIEIDRADLKGGENILSIMAKDCQQNTAVSKVKINYTIERTWPLPYKIDWSKAKEIQDVAQVVDGLWVIDHNGVRNLEAHYDRIIAIGDLSWTDYELSVSVTFHDYTPPIRAHPNYGGTYAGLAVRWKHHYEDGKQPNWRWYPLGATAAMQISEDRLNCRWRIRGDKKIKLDATEGLKIELHVPYMMKMRVETLPDDRTKYMVKLWRRDEPEPDAWDLETWEEADVRSGSALLIAHNTIVTFGNLEVVPIQKGTE